MFLSLWISGVLLLFMLLHTGSGLSVFSPLSGVPASGSFSTVHAAAYRKWILCVFLSLWISGVPACGSSTYHAAAYRKWILCFFPHWLSGVPACRSSTYHAAAYLKWILCFFPHWLSGVPACRSSTVHAAAYRKWILCLFPSEYQACLPVGLLLITQLHTGSGFYVCFPLNIRRACLWSMTWATQPWGPVTGNSWCASRVVPSPSTTTPLNAWRLRNCSAWGCRVSRRDGGRKGKGREGRREGERK